MNKTWILITFLAAFGAFACGDDDPPPAGERDLGTVEEDAGIEEDVGMDEDTGTEEDAGTDAGEEDAGNDAEPEDSGFVFPDMGPPEPMVFCDPDMPADECPAEGCGAGLVCTPGFCGGESCVPGRPCTEDVQCGSGDCVREAGAPPEVRGVCAVSDGPCDDADDCLRGFSCEAGACVDRRVPCGFHLNTCPRGHHCTFAPIAGGLFCVPVLTSCTSDGQCEDGARCIDVDGDSHTECLPAGMCDSNVDCDEGTSCGVDPGTSQASCEIDGACRAGECPDGFTCLDTGAGSPRCVASGGSCTHDSECPAQAVCGAIEAADSLRCLTFDEEAEL